MSSLIAGFTGNRAGMTQKQHETVISMVEALQPETAHHGDCTGSDAEFDAICAQAGTPVILHPPFSQKWRAHCTGAHIIQVMPEADFLARDMDIVKACHVLIATPHQDHEVVRSGTWVTIRYAKRCNRVIFTVYPDGETGSMQGSGKEIRRSTEEAVAYARRLAEESIAVSLVQGMKP